MKSCTGVGESYPLLSIVGDARAIVGHAQSQAAAITDDLYLQRRRPVERRDAMGDRIFHQ